MSEFVDVKALDEGLRGALRRLVLTLADSKRLMGIRYSDWVLGAPSLETGIAASSMAQDEWGHARLLYAMLKDLGEDPTAVEHERAAEAYASIDPLDTPFSNWAGVIAAMVVVDGALTVALDDFSRGSFEPATTRVPKMIAEEEYHRSLGVAWYRRLAGSGSEDAREALRSATASVLPAALRWVGADDEAARALAEAGMCGAGAERVEAFKDSVRDVLSECGVDVDEASAAPEWDAERGRGPGRPDDESVERARGDRNRMLLVE